MEKEVRHFFLAIMKYFSKEEGMLNEEYKFDRMLIDEIYRDYIEKTKEDLRDTFPGKWVRSSLML
jgi:hypothetical protein